MHVRLKIQPFNFILSATSVALILDFVLVLRISSQSHRRTELQPVPSIESQAVIQITVTAHSNFTKLKFIIYLAISNIPIALQLSCHIEGSQIDMGSNLCTSFPINTCMYEENNQYVKVLIILNVLKTF